MPLISVIIPTYNRAHTLGRAVKSALAQTFTDFELMIVDDGSTDNTGEVARSFADARIHYLKHARNLGASAARNTGIKSSRGRYISFLDSDDEWTASILQEQLDVIDDKQKNPVIVVTGMQTYDDSLQRVTGTNLPRHSGYVYEKFFQGKVGGNCTMLVPRQCFDDVGMYDENLPASQHWDMGVRLAARYEFLALPKPLYIVHRDDATHVWMLPNRLKATEYLLQKYATEAKRYPRWGAAARLSIGRKKLQCGQRREARREFLASIRLYPYLPGTYRYLFFSLLGVK
jgi:glycosyltransferase involved in cell wall biosynthesis